MKRKVKRAQNANYAKGIRKEEKEEKKCSLLRMRIEL